MPEVKARVIEPGKIRPELEVLESMEFPAWWDSVRYIDRQLDMGFACSRVRENGRYRVTVMGFRFP